MPKRLMAPLLVLSLMVSVTGLARAQTPLATPAPSTTETPAPAAAADSSRLFSVNEIVAIGAGAVVGGMLVQATMVHGLALFGAAAGGWLGDWMYNQHSPHKIGG